MRVQEGKIGKVNILVVLAIVIVIVASVNLIVTFNKIGYLTQISGYATGTGTANLTVEAATEVNFTTNNINWSSGRVTSGATYATLNTSIVNSDNITNGNWTSSTAGLVLANIGNVNVTLSLGAGKTNTSFIGGGGAGSPWPRYGWNISNVEAGSCTVGTGFTLDSFSNTNSSARVCSVFAYEDAKDSIRIDIALIIPSNAQTGALSDTLTATATAI